MNNCWLVKQEPDSYPFEQFVRDKETEWEGVRNFQARNNLRAMRKGDDVLFYASGDLKAVIGTAKVAGTPHPDATATEGDWTSIRLRAGKALARPVSLAEIKAHRSLSKMTLVRNSRLSVMPVSPEEFGAVLALGKR